MVQGPVCVNEFHFKIEQVLDWADEALELMRHSVKDPHEKARVIKRVLEIHCEPFRWGEVMREDTFALGRKIVKSRTGRVRIYYHVGSNHKVVLKEIVRRADAYEHGKVNNRRSRRGA